MNRCIANLIIICTLSILTSSCNKVHYNSYSKCKPNLKRECPFAIYFKKDSIIKDTLFYSVTIYNITDNAEIINMDPYVSLKFLNDTSIRFGYQSSTRRMDVVLKYDEHNRQLVNCKNCFQYYSITSPYKSISIKESYTVNRKIHILNIDKINHELLIQFDWYIPDYLNNYCPKIWTGSVISVCKI